MTRTRDDVQNLDVQNLDTQRDRRGIERLSAEKVTDNWKIAIKFPGFRATLDRIRSRITWDRSQ